MMDVMCTNKDTMTLTPPANMWVTYSWVAN